MPLATHATVPFYQIDAFASEPFRGNPAAVCLFESPPAPELMQAIASEMNLSETAFLVELEARSEESHARFALRWFTPAVEVPLCGHATLASAKVLFDELRLPVEEFRFETASGVLRARRSGTGFEIDLPERRGRTVPAPDDLLAAFGRPEVVECCRTLDDRCLLLRLPDGTNLRELRPDFGRLLALPDNTLRGVVVTAASSGAHDFHSRYFAPWAGVAEDPVTGAAHCVLGPYWSAQLGKRDFRAFQASARGGEVGVRLAEGRVFLSGGAVTVIRGTLDC